MMNSPLFILELTSQCNINCLFCYNVWKENESYETNTETDELSVDEIKQLIDTLVSDLAHINKVPAGFALAGGEPLLNPDITEIASYIRSLNIPVNIVTNGILLTKEKIEQLKAAGVDQFEISLPALSPESYKTITQTDKAATVRESILNLKSIHPEAHLSVAVTVTALNYHEIGDIIELSYAFSVDSVVLNRFVPGGEGIANREQLELSHSQLKSVLHTANAMSEKCKIPVTVAIPVEPCIIPHNEYPNLRFGSCVCGESKWTIDPRGNLRICEQSPDILGNLFADSISVLMNSSQVTSFRNDMPQAECNICPSIKNCGGGCRFAR